MHFQGFPKVLTNLVAAECQDQVVLGALLVDYQCEQAKPVFRPQLSPSDTLDAYHNIPSTKRAHLKRRSGLGGGRS
eukprot:1147809-Pelagomonas_calceolata.AAC.7